MTEKKKDRLLVVDDEQDICRALAFLLGQRGYEVETAHDGEEALRRLARSDFALVLTDLRMEGMDGMELVRRMRERHETVIPVMMTAFASVESAVEAMRLGAADYIVKPFVNEDVILTVERLLEHRRIVAENKALRRQLSQQTAERGVLGESSSFRKVMDLLEKVAPTKSNILILGESGTGKGLVAEMVHRGSPRRDRPFMAINCSAIPENLLESELFGYRKGAFTGASTDKMGLIRLADGGTLFLDEIGDMPLPLQAKVLKVLETGQMMPLGDTREKTVDIRVLAATNRDLGQMIREGRFREDLYYRLNVFEVRMPPLRERRDDIRILARHFLERFSRENGKRLSRISDEAMRALADYAWPGNVRELRNVMERAVVLASGEAVEAADLPEKVREGGASVGESLRDQLAYHERRIILDTLNSVGGNREKAAERLGVDVATLYRKIKKLAIEA